MSYARQLAGALSELVPGVTITFDYSYARNGVPITEAKQISYETIMTCWSDAERAAIGIYPLVDDTVPVGKYSTAETFELVSGTVHRRYTLADIPLETYRQNKLSAIDRQRDAILSGGYAVPSDVSEALAGKVLQTRDTDDRTNWLTSQASYSAAVAVGQGATVNAKFRGADNETVTVSYLEGLQVLLAMAAWGAAVYDRSWALKDEVEAAADVAAVNAIDVTAGWP